MAKAKKIELPENVDYLKLVDESIAAALADIKGNGLSSTEEESLRHLTPAFKLFLAKALKIAAKDGLYDNEVTGILGDVNDLIYKASKASAFASLKEHPEAKKFKLSLPTIEAIKNSSQEELDVLCKDLQALHPVAGDQILEFFKTIGRALAPAFKVLAAKILEIGAKMLASTVHDKVDGPMKSVLEEGIKDVAGKLGGVIIGDEKVTEEKVTIAVPSHDQEKAATVVVHTEEKITSADAGHHLTAEKVSLTVTGDVHPPEANV